MDRDNKEEITEESTEEELGELEPAPSKEIGGGPFDEVKRTMSDEALSNPDVGRLLFG